MVLPGPAHENGAPIRGDRDARTEGAIADFAFSCEVGQRGALLDEWIDADRVVRTPRIDPNEHSAAEYGQPRVQGPTSRIHSRQSAVVQHVPAPVREHEPLPGFDHPGVHVPRQRQRQGQRAAARRSAHDRETLLEPERPVDERLAHTRVGV